MNKTKLSFGIVGIASAAVFLVFVAISVLGHGSFSLLNGFISELGRYTTGYLSASLALLFNIGLAVSGLFLCAFMIGYGIQKAKPLYIATSFFGILTSVLIAALAVFTLNVASIHYTVTIILFASAFVTCALFIISSLVSDGSRNVSLASILVAFVGGVLSITFAVFVQIGNMPEILSLAFSERAAAVPFVLVEWAAILLVFALAALLGVKMLLSSSETVQKSSDVTTSKTKVPIFKARNSKNRNVDF